MPEPLLIHLPHSSVHIADDDRKEIFLDDSELNAELLKLTDRYTDELFDCPVAVIHKNLNSRIVIDPERFRSDKDEIMSHFGMGAIYTHSESGRLIKNITEARREELMKKYYDPYHDELEKKTQQILDEHGKCLIIDGHSFPEAPLHFELDKSPDRPDICIGTCDFHTPEKLILLMEDFIKANGFTVKRDAPFAGTIVPMKYYRKDKRVCSVMIEVNRRLYMDKETGGKLPGFDDVRSFILNIVGKMTDSYAENRGIHK
jgi:N-formylglutamate deformylase